jgi:arabinose-5-phosphate isomerase
MSGTSTTSSHASASDQAGSGDLAFLRSVLKAESEAVGSVSDHISAEELDRAVALMLKCAEAGGSILVAGVGKSGLIGRKISATLASLGVPSHDIHPTEAMHGDLGRISPADVVLALSFSGETEELVTLASVLKQDGIPIISITGGTRGNGGGALARLASVALHLGKITEASDLALAPTCSTTATLALGDALALTIARRRAFTADDFARRHPGGSLGGLLRPVVDVLRFRVGENLPVVSESTTVDEALRQADSGGRRPGALLVTDADGAVSGIFTDGDLRRLVMRTPDELSRPMGEVMTRSPQTLRSDALVRDAVRMVREFRQDEIPVVDEAGGPVGLLDVQDLIALRVVQN